MEYVYHGSPLKDLRIIKGNISTHNKRLVYATASKAVATIFLSKKGNDLYYNLSGDGINYQIELVERKKGMFKEICNCDGYIYKLDAYNFNSELTSWSAEVVSFCDEKVISCEYIENVYDELIKLDNEGLIKLFLYPNRPNVIPLDNSDLIKKVIRWYKNGYDLTNFYKLYPELKEKVVELLD